MKRIKQQTEDWKIITLCDRVGTYRINSSGEVQSCYYENTWKTLKGKRLSRYRNDGSVLLGVDLLVDGVKVSFSFEELLAIYFGGWDFTKGEEKKKLKKFRQSTLEKYKLSCKRIDQSLPLHYTNLGIFSKNEMPLYCGAVDSASNKNRRLQPEDVRAIREQYEIIGPNVLAVEYGLSYNTIRRIYTGEFYGDMV